MNQTPQIRQAMSDFEFRDSEGDPTVADRDALEVSCINLISKLENLFSKARELERDDFIDESSEIGRKILAELDSFRDAYLSGVASEQSAEEIERAEAISHTYDEVLGARPLGKALLRTFWEVEETPDIVKTHAKLGDAIVRSCAATFYHTIILAGPESELGQQIDQSTVVFVDELKQSWN